MPRALGIWAAVSALALAVGPLVGGLLIEAASWRWIFFVNVPFAIAGIAILLARGTESRDPSASRVDVTGVAVLAVGLTAIVFALIEADEWGWGSVRTLGLLLAGAAVLAGFRAIEGRTSAPLVDFSLFRSRPYLGATAAAFALVGSYWAVMFFQPQYLQDELGYSAIAAGALVLPITAPMAAFSPLSGRFIARFGARATMTAGMLVGLAGLVLMAALQDTDTYARLLPGFLLLRGCARARLRADVDRRDGGAAGSEGGNRFGCPGDEPGPRRIPAARGRRRRVPVGACRRRRG